MKLLALLMLSGVLVACGTKKETPDVTGVASTIDDSQSTITGTGPHVADGTATSIVTVTLKNSQGEAVAGVTPQFSASGSGNAYGSCTVSGTTGVSSCSMTSTKSETKTLSITWPVSKSGGTVVFNAGSAAKLCFQTQPLGGTAGVAWTTQPVLIVGDSNCNVITSATDNVSVALTTGTGTLSGTTSVSAVAGVATFTDLKIQLAGTDKVLTAAATGLTPALSNSFTVTAGTPAQLSYTTQPGGGGAGLVWATQPVVKVLDSYGNVVTNSSASVTLALTTGSGTLAGGLLTRNASLGVATFGGLTLNSIGSNKVITATSSGLSSAVSNAFSITAGTASRLAFSTQPANGTAGVSLGTQPVVQVLDAYGNLVTGSSANITLGLTTGSGTLSGSVSMSASSGVANFSGLALNLTGTNKVLTASSSGLAGTTSTAFTVGAAATLASSSINASPSLVWADGSSTSTVTVTLVDSFGNLVTGRDVILASSRGATDTIMGTLATTNGSGVATFSVKSSTGGSPTFTASVPSDSVTLSSTPMITFQGPGASVANSDWSVAPVTVVADGASTATVSVVVRNTLGNALSGKSVTLTSSRGGTDTVVGSPATTDASGIASFTIYSSTAGEATLTIAVTTDSITLTNQAKVNFYDVAPYADWQARLAKSSAVSMGPGLNSPSTSTWVDLYNLGPSNGALNNFLYNTSNSGWCGDGGTSISSCTDGPYRLQFDGATNYVHFGSGMNSMADTSHEIWLRSNSTTAIGKVILSNGDASSHGLTLRQSWDKLAKFELTVGSARSYPGEVSSDTPTSYFRLDDSSGTLGIASVGATNGTYTGTYTLAQATALNDNKYSVNFNGTNAYLNVGNFYEGTTDHTVEAWVYPTNITGTRPIVSKQSGTRGFSLELSGGLAQFRVINSAGTTHTVTGTTTLSTNTWYHVVGVRDSVTSKIYIYVNGIEEGNASFTGTVGTSTTAYYIGRNNTSYFAGRIDEAATYSTALSSTRVAAHFNAQARYTCYSTTSLSTSSWRHVVSTFDSSTQTLKLYVNGNNECTKTSTGQTLSGSNYPFTAGASVNNSDVPQSGTYWSGHIGDIRVYNSVLSAGQITNNFNASTARFP